MPHLSASSLTISEAERLVATKRILLFFSANDLTNANAGLKSLTECSKLIIWVLFLTPKI